MMEMMAQHKKIRLMLKRYLAYGLILGLVSYLPVFNGLFLLMIWLMGLIQLHVLAQCWQVHDFSVNILGKYLSPMGFFRILGVLGLLAAWDEHTVWEVWQIALCYAVVVGVPMCYFAHQIKKLFDYPKINHTDILAQTDLKSKYWGILLWAMIWGVLGGVLMIWSGLNLIKHLRFQLFILFLLGFLMINVAQFLGKMGWRVFRQPEKG